MTNVLISAAGLCGATIIGAILGFFVKELPHKWNDAVLGYCAGIMLAASTLGLIVPAFEQTSLWWLVVIGVMAGALFLNVLDLVTPHLHHITGLDPEEHRNNARLSHVMLFVMAIALHKLPEGMAAGVSVCSAEGATEWGVSFGIALDIRLVDVAQSHCGVEEYGVDFCKQQFQFCQSCFYRVCVLRVCRNEGIASDRSGNAVFENADIRQTDKFV